MSNPEDIDSTYERLDKAFPAPEADEVAGSVLEPPEPVTSKQLKVRPLQWSPVVILILLAGIISFSVRSILATSRKLDNGDTSRTKRAKRGMKRGRRRSAKGGGVEIRRQRA